MNEVYERAQELTQAGYKTIPAYGYAKNNFTSNWPNTDFQPDPTMTGVDIQAGAPIKGTNLYPMVIDIDISCPNKREYVYEIIMSYFNYSSRMYIEETASDGIHIVLLAQFNDNKNTSYSLQESNCNARHKDQVELFVNRKQIMVAPSKAINKRAKIGQYKKKSTLDLRNIDLLKVISIDQYAGLKTLLESLSSQYRINAYPHQHQVDSDTKNAIKAAYHALKAQGYKLRPLYNGCKHAIKYKWNTDADFESTELTGLQLKLGKQPDGTYLCALDFDSPSPEFAAGLEAIIEERPDMYWERSVSGGYHYIFKTNENPDIHGAWQMKHNEQAHGKLELLYADIETINIAPSSTYVDAWEFTTDPVYETCRTISGDLDDLSMEPVDALRRFEQMLVSTRRNGSTTPTECALISHEIRHAKSRIYDYGTPLEVNRIIKSCFPNPNNLLDFMNVQYISDPKKGYTRFMSLMFDDKRNPDAVLFHNYDNNKNNKWTGYSVNDYHSSGPVISFAEYLVMSNEPLFENLMARIGFNDSIENTPIKLEYTGKTVEVQCEQYPDPDAVLRVIQELLSNSKKQKVVITGPTGSGKTELFYRLAKEEKLKLIIALPYTGQVHQGKTHHTISDVLEGMCDNDRDIPNNSIFMTYDKSSWVNQKYDLQDYVLVIDESHNIVGQNDFRGEALSNLKRLAKKCKMVIYITATPEYIDYANVDLLIRIMPSNMKPKNAIVVKYTKDSAATLCRMILEKYEKGKINIVYKRSISDLGKMKTIIAEKHPDIESHIVSADLKNTCQVYDNISKHQKLAGNGVFENGGILFMTNLVIDGVNIHDENIGNVFMIDINNTTDLIQYPSRFRAGYDNFFILISGNKPKHTVAQRSRQRLAAMYYNISRAYRKAFIQSRMSMYIPSMTALNIQLENVYNTLDKNGNIVDESVLYQVQERESGYMNYDTECIKAYMEKPEYNFTVSEYGKAIPDKPVLTSADIDWGKKLHRDKNKKLAEMLKDILRDKEHEVARNEILRDFVKKNKKTYQILSKMFNIAKHKPTNRFGVFFGSNECKTVLRAYCVALEIHMNDPMVLVDKHLSEDKLTSVRRTVNNIRANLSDEVLIEDEYYDRYTSIKQWIHDLKNGSNTVEISADQLKQYAYEYSNKKSTKYHKQNVLSDLKDIFDVKKDKSKYIVGNEWSITNVHGIDFPN